MTRFFHATAQIRRGDAWVSHLPSVDFDADMHLFRTGETGGAAVPLVHVQGAAEKDFIQGGLMGLRLVTDEFLAVLRGTKATGWTTYAVEIGGLPLRRQYHGFAVTGRCGPEPGPRPDEDATGRGGYRGRPGPAWFEKNWDGSDVFSPDASYTIIMTERVVAALGARRISGLEFVPINEGELA